MRYTEQLKEENMELKKEVRKLKTEIKEMRKLACKCKEFDKDTRSSAKEISVLL